MEKKDQELVQILVPKRHLARIYGFIGELDSEEIRSDVVRNRAESSTEPGFIPDSTTSTSEIADVWSPELIRRAYEESPPAMKAILRLLAQHPGQRLAIDDLVKAVAEYRERAGIDKPTDWNSVAGVLGAFGRRVANRYGARNRRGGAIWPFESEWDYANHQMVYEMPRSTAEVIVRML